MKETTIAKKQKEVDQLAQDMAHAGSTVFVDYLGLTVAQITLLRTKLHQEACEMRVVKNNILKRATEKAGFVVAKEKFIGPSAAVFSKDEVSASRIVYEHVKLFDKLTVKAGIVDKKVLEPEQLKIISGLPNKEGMLSMLLSVLQAPLRGLACAIKAIAEK